jgi:hypothetical protein
VSPQDGINAMQHYSVKSYVLLLALVVPLSAQTPGSVAADASIRDSLIKHWKTSGEFTIAVANAMPAENYGFRPNPEEMSFGELITHIGAFAFLGCQSASGINVPEFPGKINEWARAQTKVEIDKATALPFLRDAFAFCDKAIESMTAESLAKRPARAAGQTGFDWLWQYFTHTAHHRGQAEVYLRLKGIKPPEYVF